jgi:[1-hydroxy-2-(trimethylamino)ethyl]phosphonate dioxygenase
MPIVALTSLDDLINCMRETGLAWYGQERVTQLQHACQCAYLAEQDGAGDALISAALLHDIAHLTHTLGEDCAENGIDDHHERAGANLLSRWFPKAVTEPVRLHVAAKRYLCTAEPEYFASLSLASRTSLQLQGGRFQTKEAVEFARQPGAADAVRLRRWDDLAKDPEAQVPDLEYFTHVLRRAALH